jgi:uncharacterized protein (TIGR02145 family)
LKKQFLKTAFSIFIFSILCGVVNAQVGIGTTSPHASAVLDLTTTTQGLLPPRMTQAQRNAIISAAAGLIIWCTNCGAAGELQVYNGTTWTNLTGGTASAGIITGLTCGSATNNGTLTSGIAASGVSSVISYTGGNGATHSGQTVTSTGVTGLTATLSSGTFASGSGSLTYTITGTPASSGTATFALNIGGQTCNLTRTVLVAAYPVGSVHCISGGAAIVDVTNPTTGKTWMDRNLGATQVATSSTDADSYGDLYQWGRFSDGHQCRNSTNYDGTSTRPSTITSTGSWDGKFITIPGTNRNDWVTTQTDNAWNTGTEDLPVKTATDPCPSGYRLPTETELNNERLSWVQAPITSTNTSIGAFASPLKLPMSGYRVYSDGLLYFVGTSGRYWSSTVNSTSSHTLYFDSSDARIGSSSRANGLAVRCIKD